MYKPTKAELTYILANLNKPNDELFNDLGVTTASKKKEVVEYLENCRSQQKPKQDVKLAVDPREAKAVMHEPIPREQELQLSDNKRALLTEGLILYDPNPNK